MKLNIKILSFFVLLSMLVSPGDLSADMTCSPANFRVTLASSNTTNPSITIPTTVPAGALVVLGVYNRTDGGAVVNSVSDNVNGASGWTQGSSATNSWLYYKTNSASGTITVNLVMSAAVNTHIVAGWCTDTAGTLIYDAASSVLNFPSSASVNSNNVSANSAGGMVGFIGSDGSSQFTVNGSNELVLSTYEAFQRAYMFFESFASSGTYGFQTTANPAISGNFHVVGFRPSGSVTPPPPSPAPSPTPTPTPTPSPPTPTPPAPTPTPTPPPQAGTFDSSEYRQNTYGTPDHYCDPTRSLSSSGTGTISNPWNLNQCQSLPQCGAVVGIMNVGNGTPVQIPVPSIYQEPAFDPTGITDCTAQNPLVYTARYAAISLDRSTIATDPNRSEFRTNGTREMNEAQGTGRAVYGSYNHDYVIYDGIFVDMAQAGINGDQGIITARNCVGCEFRNFKIKGMVTDMDSNPIIWRPDNTLNSVLSNFEVWGFDNQPGGGGLNQQGLFSDQYGDQNYLIEHFLIDTPDNAIFAKGTAVSGSVFNYGTIRYGIVNNAKSCFRFNDFHPTQLTTLQYSICQNYTQFGLGLTSETSPARNFLMHNVTIANSPCSSNCSGPIYIKDDTSANNVTIRDNILDYLNGGMGHGVDAGEATFTMPNLNFNGYYRAGLGLTWAYNGQAYNSLSAWRSATGRESNSQVLSSSPFVNRSSGDFRVSNGHTAKTMSSTGEEIGAYANGGIIGFMTSATPSPSPVPPPVPPPTPPTPTPIPIAGDLNLDHIVNSLDFSIMNSQWLTSNSQSDLRVDGQVNSLDFAILSSNWGRTW